MFENAYTGINDCNNEPIHNGMKIFIIDKKLMGDVRYSFRSAGFRIFTGDKKPQEAKTYSVASCGSTRNNNLCIVYVDFLSSNYLKNTSKGITKKWAAQFEECHKILKASIFGKSNTKTDQ